MDDNDDDNDDYYETVECPDCGGQMTWCPICYMYTKKCCQDYGSCQCS